MFDDLEGMGWRVVVLGALPSREAGNAEVIFVAGGMRARDSDLHRHERLDCVLCIDLIFPKLTVDVTSIEHTSQWNLVPASVPREAVFFRITPIGLWALSSSTESEAVAEA